MIPIIQELLEVEEQAKRIVTEARENVQREQTAVEQEEHERHQEARKAADERYQTAISQARNEAEARLAQMVETTQKSDETFKTTRRQEIEHAVNLVANEICTTELESR